ncbi:MAG: DNA-3-methyladenine glycosylase family protein [Phycisphaerae bacterium]
MRRTIVTPPDFDFRAAVCSHGFFVLAPNTWIPARQSLRTIVTLDENTAVPVVIREAAAGSRADVSGNGLVVSCPAGLSQSQRMTVLTAVCRTLRLNEDLSAFHERCRASKTHRQAAEMRFGRLLRSASLFEDVVKVMCTCNTSWTQTVTMVRNITNLCGVPVEGTTDCSFPTPARLARVSPAILRRKARVGYRADFLHRLACDVVNGKIDLEAIESFHGSCDELYPLLRSIHGVGDYAAAHLCMLLGHYDRLAVDTELKRFLSERYPGRRFTPAALRACYDHWKPYQFLAYWYDLWSDYTRRHGQSHRWDPAQVGRRITNR